MVLGGLDFGGIHRTMGFLRVGTKGKGGDAAGCPSYGSVIA